MALAHIDPPPATDDSVELGVLIRQARERAGLRQVDLAAAVHVGLSTLASWERGVHDVPADALPVLADALGVGFAVDSAGFRILDAPEDALDAAPDPAPAPPQVVVIVAATAEAMREALDRAGVPRAQ